MLTLGSWNVNSIRARETLFRDWLLHRKPDIVLLQETKVQDALFPTELFDQLGYNLSLAGQKTYNGVAIASKAPIEAIPPSMFEEGEARYIEAITFGIRVASVYVPNGQDIGSEKFAYKLRFLSGFQTHLKQFFDDDMPFIVGGDFNIAPYDNDVSNPKKWKDRLLCSPLERNAIRQILYEGWDDPLDKRNISNQKNGFTWWDYRGRAFHYDTGLRIDYFLLSPRARDCFEDGGVDKDFRKYAKPSDHAPIWITLNHK